MVRMDSANEGIAATRQSQPRQPRALRNHSRPVLCEGLAKSNCKRRKRLIDQDVLPLYQMCYAAIAGHASQTGHKSNFSQGQQRDAYNSSESFELPLRCCGLRGGRHEAWAAAPPGTWVSSLGLQKMAS